MAGRPSIPNLIPDPDVWHRIFAGLFAIVERAERFAERRQRKPVETVCNSEPMHAETAEKSA